MLFICQHGVMVGSSHVNMGPSLSLVLTDYPLSSALAIRLRRCTPLPHICSTCLPSPALHYTTTCKLLCHRNNVACCLVSQQHQLNDKKTTNTKIAGSLNTCLQHPWRIPHFRYCAIMCLSLSLLLVSELVTRDGISLRGISKFEDSTRKLSSICQ